MKKVIALAAALFASSAYANINGSPHDLAGTAGAGACQFCHIVHRANPAGTTFAPIWARSISSTGLTGYNANGLVANLGSTKFSLLCMSCHDGATSMNTLWTGATLPLGAGVALDANTNLGTNLGDDHPVAVLYPLNATAPTDSGLVARSVAAGRGFVFYGTGTDTIECSSCHEPHTWSGTPSAASYKFKRAVSGGLDFCASCHELK